MNVFFKCSWSFHFFICQFFRELFSKSMKVQLSVWRL
jgi:hypothetical protein